MMDIAYVAMIIAFFAASVALAAFCAQLMEKGSER